LLNAIGEKRGRYYVGAPLLLEIRARTGDATKAGDPYDVIRQREEAGQFEFAV
jgi:hypothetical protein